MKLIDGKKIAAELRNKLKVEVDGIKKKFNKVPGLAVILIGDLAPSQIYVKNKEKSAKEVGLNSEVIRYANDVDENTILKKINDIETNFCAIAERKMLQTIGGDCETAIGGLAEIQNHKLKLRAQLFSDSGEECFEYELKGKDTEALFIGKSVGEKLLNLAGEKFKKKI